MYFMIDGSRENRKLKTTEEQKKLDKGLWVGGLSKAFLRRFHIFNTWFSEKFFNHGNIVAHLFDVVVDQMNIKGDREAFGQDNEDHSPEGRSLNKFMSRGMYFPGSISKDYCSWIVRDLEKPADMPWGYFITGLLYIWEQKDIIGKIDYKYYDETHPLPSYKKYKPEDNVAYELRVKNRKFMPHPKYIIIGKAKKALKKKERMDIEYVKKFVAKKYPNTTLIYLPHLHMQVSKKADETGNKKRSINAYRVMEIIYGIEKGWYDDFKEDIE